MAETKKPTTPRARAPRKPRTTAAKAAPPAEVIMGDEDMINLAPIMEGSRSSRVHDDSQHDPRFGETALRHLRRLEGLVMLLLFVLAVSIFAATMYVEAERQDAKAAKIETFYSMLKLQHMSAVRAAARARTEAMDEAKAAPDPVVLTSVTQFRDGEQVSLQANLVAPILAYDSLVKDGPRLEALLIERTNATSRDVRVRLFTDDGNETSYLWPSTHSLNGTWVSGCVATVEEVDVDSPELCPEGYVKPTL